MYMPVFRKMYVKVKMAFWSKWGNNESIYPGHCEFLFTRHLPASQSDFQVVSVRNITNSAPSMQGELPDRPHSTTQHSITVTL